MSSVFVFEQQESPCARCFRRGEKKKCEREEQKVGCDPPGRVQRGTFCVASQGTAVSVAESADLARTGARMFSLSSALKRHNAARTRHLPSS